MKFNTAFVLVVCCSIGLSSCFPAKIETARNDIQRILSDAKSMNNNIKEDEINLFPAFEALFGLIDMEAALELISLETGCGVELREYLQGNFSYVIDDFYAQPGLYGIFEYIHDNGFEDVYQLIGIIHLLMGMKLPPFPYPTAQPQIQEEIIIPQLAAEECTPEDQAKILELTQKMVPIWKMIDLFLELLATDHSFVSLILRIRLPLTVEGYQTFIVTDSAKDLGARLEEGGINPKMVVAVLNVLFGVENSKF